MADPISYYVEILKTNKKGKAILGYVPSQDNIEELDIAATKRHMRVIGERFADSINDNIRIYKPSSNKSAYFVFKGNVENPLSPMQDGSIASVNFGLLTRCIRSKSARFFPSVIPLRISFMHGGNLSSGTLSSYSIIFFSSTFPLFFSDSFLCHQSHASITNCEASPIFTFSLSRNFTPVTLVSSGFALTVSKLSKSFSLIGRLTSQVFSFRE